MPTRCGSTSATRRRITPGLGFQAATVTAIEGKRAEIADFVRRLAAARRWADSNPDVYAAWWAKLMKFPESVPRQWFNRIKGRIVVPDAVVAADLQKVIDTYAKAGLLRGRLNAAATLDASFAAQLRRPVSPRRSATEALLEG